MPGKHPHPRRHPDGHSYGVPEPTPSAVQPARWRDSAEYLYGIDLYNHGYWWECHEVFEALWHAVGPKTQQGRFLQGLIQLAAACLKRADGQRDAAQRLLQRARITLAAMPAAYMGLDVAGLVRKLADDGAPPAELRLEGLP